MHLIEKEILAESLYVKMFQLYQQSIIAGYMVKHNVQLPALVLECKGKGTAGHYSPQWRDRLPVVTINLAYYNGGSTANLECTIAHELAHHIAHCIWPNAKQWHGAEFRMVMLAVGYDGSTYHHMSVSNAKKVASKAKDELFDF